MGGIQKNPVEPVRNNKETAINTAPLINRAPVLARFALAALILLPACSRIVTNKTGPEKTVYLDARSDWHATGMRVEKGQKMRVECRGTWAVAPENERQRWPDTGPEGHGRHPGEKVHKSGDPKKELPGTAFGVLLGKISGAVFPIGNRKEIVAPTAGELFLVINDYPFYRHDNRGGLSITLFAE
jgi:hypothetical protein